MHNYHDTQQSPYSTQQIFDLVIDIERYPEFLPWCRSSRILERKEGEFLAELVISFKHITESYLSKVTFRRPPSPGDDGVISVTLVQGPFKHLVNRWEFKPVAAGGSDISLELSFKFRSKILDSIIGLLFGNAVAKMGLAFKQRANALYCGKS